MGKSTAYQRWRREVGTVWRSGNALGRALLALTIGGIAFEWGPGNEMLLAAVGGKAIDRSHAPIVTGAATAAVSMLEQFVFGLLMALTIASFPSFAGVMLRLRSTGDHKESFFLASTPWGRFLLAFALGSSAVVLVTAAQGVTTTSRLIRLAAHAAALIGLGVFFVGFLIGTLDWLGRKYGWGGVTDPLVRVLTNPLLYIGLFVTNAVLQHARPNPTNADV